MPNIFKYPGAKKHNKPHYAPPSNTYPGTSNYNNPYQHAPQNNYGPPPLQDLERWFNYYDRDGSGSLDKEEVTQGLIQTFNATTSSQQSNIRESVYNVWPMFDTSNYGRISKCDFCSRGGLGESLLAIENDMKNPTPNYGVVTGYGNAPPVILSPPATNPNVNNNSNNYYGNTPSTNYREEAPSQLKTVKLKVVIPSGMKTGQQLRVANGNEIVTVAIPERDYWDVDASCHYYFIYQHTSKSSVPLMKIPQNPSYSAAAPSWQSSSQPPWQSFSSITNTTATPTPPLGMQPATITESVAPNGRYKALLIGINYTGTRAELRGCVNDVINMKGVLLRDGFSENNMTILTDKQIPGSTTYMPTKANIFQGLQWLVNNVVSGDVLFFHFSGHGAQVPDKSGLESDGYNETILSVDYNKNGQIVDDELWSTLIYPLPSGVRLTCIMDCCHSGTGLDLPFGYQISSHRWDEDVNPAHSKGDAILFSGCEDSQTSADVMEKYQAGGAMTNAFVQAYAYYKNTQQSVAFPEFLKSLHHHLKKKGFKQRPVLTTSQAFDINRPFSLTQGMINGNQNQHVGRIKKRHVRPGKKDHKDFHNILFKGAAIFAGAAILDAIF